jgi:hypothetical protein
MLLIGFLAIGGIALGFDACLRFRNNAAGWSVIFFSALWLPANNKYMEGTVLFGISAYHGVTTSDLLAVLGAIAGVVTLTRPAEWRGWRAGDYVRTTAVAAASGLVLATGGLAAYLTG